MVAPPLPLPLPLPGPSPMAPAPMGGMPMAGPAMPMGGMPMGDPSMLPPGIAGPLPPMPMPMPPAPMADPFSVVGPVNPLLMLLMDPDLLTQLLGPQPLPRHREKWQEPPKPTEGAMLTKARADQTLLSALNRRFEDNLARIRDEAKGVFEDFDEDAESVFESSALADEDQLIASLVGTIPPAFESPKRRAADADESQAKEDFLVYLHEEHRRQHARAGFGDLDMEMTKTLTRYGRLCTRTLCAFDARPGNAPFRMKLIDPATVYPTFMGDRGLVTVTLVYYQRVGDFIGDHDTDGSLERKVLATPKEKRGGKTYDLNDEIEVIEYWDCKWFGLFAGGTLVKQAAHDYGEPPFVYTVAPYGDPGYTRTPEQRSTILQNGVAISPVQADIARRGLSHFHTRFGPHAQRQAILGRMVTAFRMWKMEPIWVQKDAMAPERPEWSRAAGAVNEVPEGWNIIPGPDSVMPPSLPVLMAASNEDMARGGLSPEQYGLTPSAQQSGYAIAGLSQHGKNKLAPVIRAKQDHHALVGEQRLRMYRDFGHALGEEGTRGSVTIPRALPPQRPDEEPSWTVTPEMIDRTGWHVTCRLVEMPGITELASMLNSFGMGRQQGVVSREEEIRLLGLPSSRNPLQAMQQIDVEALKEMPEYKLGKLLRYVEEEEGDVELAAFIREQIARGRAREQASAAPPQGPPQGPGGPPMGGGGGPAQVPGLSLPGMGQPPGTEGGRPPGPPPGMMSGPPLER